MKAIINRAAPVKLPVTSVTLEVSVAELSYIAAAVATSNDVKVDECVEGNAFPPRAGTSGCDLWVALRKAVREAQ